MNNTDDKPTKLYQPKATPEWLRPQPPICPTCNMPITGIGIWAHTYEGDHGRIIRMIAYYHPECIP